MSQVLLFLSFGYIVLLLFLVGTVLNVSLSPHLDGACCSDADTQGFVDQIT